MRFYRLLDTLFPRSYPGKILFVAFVGTHVPLLSVVAYALVSTGQLAEKLPLLLTVLIATLVGCGTTLAAIWALLAPIRRTRRAIRDFEAGETARFLPEDHRDALGDLMRMTNRMMRGMGDRLAGAREAALTDPLTGIANRRGFEAAVDAGDTGALLYLDLDRFKQVNDRHGHATGDALLQQTAQAFGAALRDGDVLARIGGEEFGVWLPGLDRAAAMALAERLRAACEAQVRVGDDPVTVSIGCALRRAGENLAQTSVRADAALYAAKARGRNRVIFEADAAPVAPTKAATAG